MIQHEPREEFLPGLFVLQQMTKKCYPQKCTIFLCHILKETMLKPLRQAVFPGNTLRIRTGGEHSLTASQTHQDDFLTQCQKYQEACLPIDNTRH